MPIQTPLHAEHQLDQLVAQFAHWRQTRPHPHRGKPNTPVTGGNKAYK